MISATPGREVRQELYLNTQYEKARQDVGLFYYQNLIRVIRIMLILEKINISHPMRLNLSVSVHC